MPGPTALPTDPESRAEDAAAYAHLVSTTRAADLQAAYRARILDLEAENDRLRGQLQAQARNLTRLAALLAEAEADYARARHLGH